jgi:2-dehydro-3-deoxyphosphogluconate aldolase/(4S)-4-hydroxy-2-oxoglutarate aldolase
MSEPQALKTLRERRVLAVIRANSPETALNATNAVAKGGVTTIEVTFTVPDAARVMAELSARGDLLVGAGTVLTADQAREAIQAGATFLVAPNFNPEVARVALDGGLLYMPGALTSSEIITAHAGGGHVIKVYPVGLVGGPKYIDVVREPLPHIPMLAAGGTSPENVVPFLKAGCVAVGLGAALADPRLAEERDFSEITRRARLFVSRLAEYDLLKPAQKSPA